MATATRELTHPPAQVAPGPAIPGPTRAAEPAVTGAPARQAAGTRPHDPYEQPVSPWLLVAYLVLVFLVVDVGMLWGIARLVAGGGP